MKSIKQYIWQHILILNCKQNKKKLICGLYGANHNLKEEKCLKNTITLQYVVLRLQDITFNCKHISSTIPSSKK